jgi:hypothetical protein
MSLLKFAAFGTHIRFGAALWHTRCPSEVLHCLTGILGSPQQHLHERNHAVVISRVAKSILESMLKTQKACRVYIALKHHS